MTGVTFLRLVNKNSARKNLVSWVKWQRKKSVNYLIDGKIIPFFFISWKICLQCPSKWWGTECSTKYTQAVVIREAWCRFLYYFLLYWRLLRSNLLWIVAKHYIAEHVNMRVICCFCLLEISAATFQKKWIVKRWWNIYHPIWRRIRKITMANDVLKLFAFIQSGKFSSLLSQLIWVFKMLSFLNRELKWCNS